MSSVAVPARKIRPEIQGLRAVAVITVLLFHIWPTALPGGYIGVDVFFVISGFLITSLLVKEAQKHGRIGFGNFYLRRAKRLLPAATMVLVFVAIMTPIVLPASQWEDVATEILASVFYVENWRLAFLAVDYLGAENAASPLQHYWSLSVEEQFYLIWPALVAGGLTFTRMGKGSLLRTLRVVFIVVIVASLIASVLETRSNPATAYFVTYTRAWELAIGGLLALVRIPLPSVLREGLSLIGLLGIMVAAFMFSGETGFPGYAALVPTIGAALVLLSGEVAYPLNPAVLLNSRPFQFVGDISYSLYLWHWPLVVFYVQSENETIGVIGGLLIVVAAIALATASKTHIEDRFRATKPGALWLPGLIKAFSFALLPVVGSALLYAQVSNQAASLNEAQAKYPGAEIIGSLNAYGGDEYVPELSVLKRDKAAAYTNGCHLGFTEIEPVPCKLGKGKGPIRVFLVGDSHAANWIPALEVISDKHGWAVTSYTKSSCALMPIMLRRNSQPYSECFEWGKRLRKIIADEKPDMVLMAQMYSHKPYYESGKKSPSLRGAIVDMWREIEHDGVKVIAIADTPRWKKSPDRCLSDNADCFVPLSSVSVKDPLVDAHRRYSGAGFIEMTDVVCPENRCPAVVGGVVVWRDRHHITATYSRSAANILYERIQKVTEN